MAILKIKDPITGKWIAVETIQGEPGEKGKDGYTPQKGVDYFDGKDGQDGKDGKDGENGKDYVLTEADKQEIASLVLAELPDSEDVSY